MINPTEKPASEADIPKRNFWAPTHVHVIPNSGLVRIEVTQINIIIDWNRINNNNCMEFPVNQIHEVSSLFNLFFVSKFSTFTGLAWCHTYLATNPQKLSGILGFGRVEFSPTTRGSVCWIDCLLFLFVALASSRFRNLVAFAPLHCKGLTIITDRALPSSSVSIPLLLLDMNSLVKICLPKAFCSSGTEEVLSKVDVRRSSFWKKDIQRQ